MATDLAQYAKKNGVKYFMISYTDLFGGQRAKLVPAAAISDMQKEGAGFAGFATWLDMTPAHPDMLAVPDPDTVIQLPWKPEVAWVASDCVMEDETVAQTPRATLKRVYVLIDARHGVKKNDEEVFSLLDKAAVSYQIVLTKTDKIKAAGVPRLIDETLAKIRKRPAAFPAVLATSSEKGAGLEELRTAILLAANGG